MSAVYVSKIELNLNFITDVIIIAIIADELWKIGRRLTVAYYPITRFWICKSAIISVLHPDDIEVKIKHHTLYFYQKSFKFYFLIIFKYFN